ncbi:MAG: ATP-binding protein [Anaerolineae bacterium]
MNSIEIRQRLQEGRGEETDFQPANATPRRLAQTMCAMANGAGGSIIIGVSGGRRPAITGLTDPETARDRAAQAALLCDPPLIIPLPKTVEFDKTRVLVISIPRGLPHAYSLDGRYLIRRATRNEPLIGPELRRLLLARGERSFEGLPARNATTADLDPAKVERYVNGLGGVGELTAEQVLRKRGCMTPSGQPTYAGILLFGKDPQAFVPGCEITVVRYAGTEMGDEFLRQDIRDTLPEQIRRAEAFLVSNMRVGARLVGFEREEKAEYPLDAVREAVVNAVAHRDYSITGDQIRVFMFADRIEVYSPGRLPGPVTVDNIVDERFSRNESIVQVLADLGFIERLGYGIDRMIWLMQQEDLPEPVFQETANGFRVTLYGHGQRLITTDTIDRSRWAHLHLNPRQEKALEYLAEHGRITNSEYQDLAPDVSAETIRRDLADLVERGLLLRIGRKRATYYIFK